MQEVEKFQLLASTSMASQVADFFYFTIASSDAISQKATKAIFFASREVRVNPTIKWTGDDSATGCAYAGRSC